MFDPLSWAIGFGAGKLANSLLEKLFDQGFKGDLHRVASQWAEHLPKEVHTVPEAVFSASEDEDEDEMGPCRERLQAILYLHSEVPTVDIWFEALLETWNIRRTSLGEKANAFLRQDQNSAQKHLRSLAKGLARACAQHEKLFRVSALAHLARAAQQGDELERQLKITRSELLDKMDQIEQVIRLPTRSDLVGADRIFADPTKPDWSGLCCVNSLVLVDAPSVVVSGRLRESDVWVGIPGSPRDNATYVAPPPLKIKHSLDAFIQYWGNGASAFGSEDTGEKIRAMAEFHHGLLSIHPFEDGNGRVARAITDLQANYCFGKPKRLGLAEKDGYQASLMQADHGDLDEFAKMIELILLNP